MRAIILAVLVAVGIGLSFTPTVYAAPASGFECEDCKEGKAIREECKILPFSIILDSKRPGLECKSRAAPEITAARTGQSAQTFRA